MTARGFRWGFLTGTLRVATTTAGVGFSPFSFGKTKTEASLKCCLTANTVAATATVIMTIVISVIAATGIAVVVTGVFIATAATTVIVSIGVTATVAVQAACIKRAVIKHKW